MKALTFASLLTAAACSTVAGDVTGSGMVVLDPSANGALSMTGNSTVQIPARAVYVNSSSPIAVQTFGQATLDTPDLYLCGGSSFTGRSGCTGAVHPSCVPFADPLARLAFPSAAGMSANAAVSIGSGQTVTLNPGYYPDGISIQGNSNVTFSPGIYLVKNQFKITAGSISGQGVCFVMLEGALSIAGTSSMSLSGPVDGCMASMVICQPPDNHAAMSLAGGSQVDVAGGIYAPGATLSLVGDSSLAGVGPVMGDLVVANRVALAGTGSIKIGHPGATAIVLPKLPMAD